MASSPSRAASGTHCRSWGRCGAPSCCAHLPRDRYPAAGGGGLSAAAGRAAAGARMGPGRTIVAGFLLNKGWCAEKDSLRRVAALCSAGARASPGLREAAVCPGPHPASGPAAQGAALLRISCLGARHRRHSRRHCCRGACRAPVARAPHRRSGAPRNSGAPAGAADRRDRTPPHVVPPMRLVWSGLVWSGAVRQPRHRLPPHPSGAAALLHVQQQLQPPPAAQRLAQRPAPLLPEGLPA
jgi:hypothetical protein